MQPPPEPDQELPPLVIDSYGGEVLNHYFARNQSRSDGRRTSTRTPEGVELVQTIDPVHPQLEGCIDINSLYASVSNFPAIKAGLRYLICQQNARDAGLVQEQTRKYLRMFPSEATLRVPDHIRPRIAGAPHALHDRGGTTMIPLRPVGDLGAALEKRGMPRRHLNASIKRTIDFLGDTGHFAKVSDDESRRLLYKYHDTAHLDSLANEMRRLHPQRDDPLPRASAFCVGKGKNRTVNTSSGGTVEVEVQRIISDLREANAFVADPPAYPMFTLEVLLQTISNIVGSNARCWAVSIDWRHFFFQLPAHEGLRCFMRTPLDGNMFALYLELAMGFSWCPYFAQSATYAIITGSNNENTYPKFIPRGFLTNLKTLPPWMPLINSKGTIVGAIFVLLDNIFIIGSEREAIDAALAHIRANRDRFGVWEKADSNGSVPGVVELVRGRPAPSVEFAGVEVSGLGFRVARKTFHQYDPAVPRSLTHRNLATYSGKLYWYMRLRCERFLEHEWMIDVMRLVTPQDGNYDKELVLPDRLAHLLTEKGKEALKEDESSWLCLAPWHAKSGQRPRVALFASDAAGQRANNSSCTAALGFERRADGWQPRWPGCTAASRHANIAISELEAYVVGVEQERDRRGESDWAQVEVVIGAIDNRVAEGWIERFWADDPEARQQLRRLLGVLGNRRCATVRVTSEQNVADIPTRRAPGEPFSATECDGQPDGPLRMAATMAVLMQAIDTINFGTTGKQSERVDISARRDREDPK